MKQGPEAAAADVDFPIFMLTDDAKGTVEAKMFSKEEYIAIMKPFFEHAPKDQKFTHRYNITVLSDALAGVDDDFSMTAAGGKMKMSGKNTGLLIKRDGKWLWKFMAEAGWGGMQPAGVGGDAAPANPTR